MNVEVDQNTLTELKKMLTPVNAGKIIFGTLVSLGATAAVIALFHNPLKSAKGIMKLLMAAGVFVLGYKAGDIAKDYFEETVDNVVETIGDIRQEMKNEEGEKEHGDDSHAGGDSGKQSEKQGDSGKGSAGSGETSGTAVRRRWWSKAERGKQNLEVDPKDVPERQDTAGDHEGRDREPGGTGDQG